MHLSLPSLLTTALGLASLPLISAAALGHSPHARAPAAAGAHKRQVFHAEVRARNATEGSGAVQGPMDRRTTSVLGKRAYPNSRATYYDIGLGACGQYNHEPDFIVALNTPQYGSGYPGPHCFQMITISANGKTAQAQIMDQCPGCPYGGLDMSQGLFEHFADTSVGVFQMTWSFNGEGDSQPTTTQQAAPTTTYTPPTTTYTPPSTTPTSTYTPPATTTTSTTQQQQQQATSASPTSAAAASSASASASASSASAAMSSLQASLSSIPLVASSAPAATATAGAGGEVGTISNLRTLSQVIVNLGSLVVVNAAGAK